MNSASKSIDGRIKELGDWRGKTLGRMRQLIQQALPDVVEEWKWAKASNPGVPVWSHNGILCTGETYKQVVKLTFMKGAALKDPARLFNSSLDGNARRAIDIPEGAKIDEAAFKALIQQAAALNAAKKAPAKKAAPKKASTTAGKPAKKTKKTVKKMTKR
ncbi:MAG TPA: DUF1801 domain-containing protein [Polyangiaceae bacterium]|nr:DUF1801 domain-containing protein [Polyangiaceae bacterium]